MKALRYPARQGERGPILLAIPAHHERIPQKFLETMLLALQNNGILESKKGQGGGYHRGRHPRNITSGRQSGS